MKKNILYHTCFFFFFQNKRVKMCKLIFQDTSALFYTKLAERDTIVVCSSSKFVSRLFLKQYANRFANGSLENITCSVYVQTGNEILNFIRTWRVFAAEIDRISFSPANRVHGKKICTKLF